MWCKTQAEPIPFVSALVYNNPMKTRCNMCMNIYDEIVIMECSECLTDDYLMDLSVVPATITSNNERI